VEYSRYTKQAQSTSQPHMNNENSEQLWADARTVKMHEKADANDYQQKQMQRDEHTRSRTSKPSLLYKGSY